MAKSAATAALETQHQIRANAAELQDYFADLYAWEKTVAREEAARKRAQPATASEKAPPVRSTRPPAAHTHDRGYSKWAKFDVEAALRDADDESGGASRSATSSVEEAPRARSAQEVLKTPTTTKSREEIEREEGNAHYKQGDFVAAIKSYTRCLGYNTRNAVVLSNRAMALLKNREFARAEDDCNLALRVDPDHLKSLSRRATARNALGKHRLALLDFERAAALDPKSRQLQTQIVSTKELLRSAIRRAPTQTGKLVIEVVEDEQSIGSTPTLLSKSKTPVQADEPEDKENAIVPRLPKKAPTTSYEFGRVWKSLALRGDPEHRERLLASRAAYLQGIRPATLRTIFRNSIEPEIVCETFYVFRHAVLQSSSAGGSAFVREFVQELAKVPRFRMAVMFLSESDKADVAWVLSHLHAQAEQQADTKQLELIDALKKSYEVS